MLLYIVRHGESERNRDRSGPYDCPLTDLGRRQAALTGSWLRGKGIAHLYCSPTIRTCETALAIAREIGVAPRSWASLVEWGFLFHEPGLTGEELERRFPGVDFSEGYPKDRGWAADRTDESWDELFERAKATKEELLRRHAPGGPTVALVTHAHFARYFTAALLELPAPPESWRGVVDIYNCSVTCFEIRGDRPPILRYANAHEHLEEARTYHP